jgi:hypothetical protein
VSPSRPVPRPGASGETPGGKPGGKGRPTPKRNEAQRHTRSGPVGPPPRTRKEAAQRARADARASRERVRGGEHLLPRDAGPVRALVRDVVDSRRSIGVLMLPLALLLVVAQISGSRRVLDAALVVWLAGIAALVVDLVGTTRAIRRRVREEHPEVGRTRSHVAYGVLRSTVFRRWRIPAARTAPPPLRG